MLASVGATTAKLLSNESDTAKKVLDTEVSEHASRKFKQSTGTSNRRSAKVTTSASGACGSGASEGSTASHATVVIVSSVEHGSVVE